MVFTQPVGDLSIDYLRGNRNEVSPLAPFPAWVSPAELGVLCGVLCGTPKDGAA